MKKEIADKWVAALRSGEYQQAKEWLKTNDGFCCLGVLCDISGLGTWATEPCEGVYAKHLGAVAYCDDDSMDATALSDKVQEWAGMFSEEGSLRDDDAAITYSLVQMNDEGWTFEEIADYIETNWEKL